MGKLIHIPPILCIDKPWGWTSFDAIKKLRGRIGVQKLGHAGTLDPYATGLLLICANEATQRIQDLQGLPKEYKGVMRLGEVRPSYDLETAVSQTFNLSHLNEKDIQKVGTSFQGEHMQTPPPYSAVKHKGRRAYSYARAGIQTSLSPRPVSIECVRVLHIHLPWVGFEVRCGKGTYIRSLVHEWGQRLRVGATLYALRRTKIGPHLVQHAHPIHAF